MKARIGSAFADGKSLQLALALHMGFGAAGVLAIRDWRLEIGNYKLEIANWRWGIRSTSLLASIAKFRANGAEDAAAECSAESVVGLLCGIIRAHFDVNRETEIR